MSKNKNMRKDKSIKLSRTIARSVIKNSFNTSAWIFTTILQLGEITIEVFLNPSIYADLQPSSFDFFKNQPKKKKIPKEMTIRQSIRRLQKQGFVKKKNGKYLLTKSGKNIAGYIINRKNIVSKKWDGKYRVIIFDIPEKTKENRDWLRQELYILNYKKLQESVFISKYSLVEDLIKEIKRRKMGNYVNYLLVDKIYKNIF
jgi:RecG-like helicase